ncbi:MAG: LytR/AlgR family response regulator transcription factor [Planctomycetia bacterium]
MITALLVDDEPKALDRLADLLEGFEVIDVIGRAGSVDEAERFLKGRVPDVVFLDITMPGRLGGDLLGSVPKGTKVVFVTARENYAVDAFRAGAVDYVLKPFDRDRLLITVERLEQFFATDEASAASEPRAGDAGGDHDQAVELAMSRGRSRTVPYADILWIEAVQNYTRVQVAGEEPVVMRRTMAEWEALLPPAEFPRISRSLFVQLTKIRSTQWQSRDQMLVAFAGLDRPLPIGRTPMARLKELLGDR